MGSMQKFTMNIGGDFTLNNSNVDFNVDLNFNGSGNQNYGQYAGTMGYSSGGYVNITVNKSSGTLYLQTDLDLISSYSSYTSDYSFTLNSGTVNMNGRNMEIGNFNMANGTFVGGTGNMTMLKFNQSNGSFTAPSGTITIKAGMNRAGGTFSHNNGTVTFDIFTSDSGGGSEYYYAVTTGNTDFKNVNIYTDSNRNGGSSQTYYMELHDNLNVTGNLSINNACSSGDYGDPTTAVRAYSGTTPQATISGNFSYTAAVDSGYNFYWGTSSQNFTTNLGGNFTLSNANIKIYSPFNFNSTTQDQNITYYSGAGIYGAWDINKSSYKAVQQNALQLEGNLTITTGVFYTNGQNLTINGTFSNTNNGTLRLQGGETLTFTKDTASGTVEYIGSGSTTYTSFNYGNIFYKLKINSTTGTNSWSPDGTVTVNNNLELVSGTLSLGSKNLTVSGTFTQSGGTFNGGASNTVSFVNFSQTDGTFNASENQTKIQTSFSRSGGIFNHQNGTVVFFGSGTATISGETTF